LGRRTYFRHVGRHFNCCDILLVDVANVDNVYLNIFETMF
jgi:hypothetical protein